MTFILTPGEILNAESKQYWDAQAPYDELVRDRIDRIGATLLAFYTGPNMGFRVYARSMLTPMQPATDESNEQGLITILGRQVTRQASDPLDRLLPLPPPGPQRAATPSTFSSPLRPSPLANPGPGGGGGKDPVALARASAFAAMARAANWATGFINRGAPLIIDSNGSGRTAVAAVMAAQRRRTAQRFTTAATKVAAVLPLINAPPPPPAVPGSVVRTRPAFPNTVRELVRSLPKLDDEFLLLFIEKNLRIGLGPGLEIWGHVLVNQHEQYAFNSHRWIASIEDLWAGPRPRDAAHALQAAPATALAWILMHMGPQRRASFNEFILRRVANPSEMRQMQLEGARLMRVALDSLTLAVILGFDDEIIAEGTTVADAEALWQGTVEDVFNNGFLTQRSMAKM